MRKPALVPLGAALAALPLFFWLSAMPLSAFAQAIRVPTAPSPAPPLLDHGTLTREPDPITIQGSALLRAQGLSIGAFRLFAHTEAKVNPIPFDLNERDEDGQYVLPSGPEPMKGTGKLGKTSELAYMAHDTGDRVQASELPAGWDRAFEIETTDPLNGRKSWVYLLHFAANPPAKSQVDYVSLTEVKEPDPLTGKPYVILKSPFFQVRNKEGSTSWYDFHGTREAGYEEKSFSDHISIRNRLKIAGIIPFSANEDTIWSDTPAYYDGAVRLIRRVKLKILIGKIKVPTGIVYDVTAYDRVTNVPAKAKIPAAVKAISRDAWAWYGLDLNKNAAGKYTFYSNTHPKGIPITGRDEPPGKSFGFDRKELIPSKNYWSVVTGPYGTVLRRHITPPELEARGVRHYLTFTDDLTKPFPPEYEKGQVGNVLSWLEVQNAPYGEMTIYSYMYTPPHFHYPEDVPMYLNILDHPLRSKVSEIK